MLKIKDNVDLKELEKFGFKYNERYDAYERIVDFGINKITTRIFLKNPNFKKYQLTAESSIWYDLLFTDERIASLNKNLIQAGLVEKVEE